jgi:hypothetical protein
VVSALVAALGILTVSVLPRDEPITAPSELTGKEQAKIAPPDLPAKASTEPASLASLPLEQQATILGDRLRAANPGFDGKVAVRMLYGQLDVNLLSDHVHDLSPLRALPGLQRLNCSGHAGTGGMLTDLRPLRDMDLTDMTFNYQPRLRDLTPLAGKQFTTLSILGTGVEDLSPLRGNRQLHLLNMGNTMISNLEPLRGLKLGALYCGSSKIDDLRPLEGMAFVDLNIKSTRVRDYEPLRRIAVQHLFIDVENAPDRDILAAIATLQTINRQPAQEFIAKLKSR